MIELTKQRKLREFAARLHRAVEYRGLPEHGKASTIASEFEKRGIQMSSMSVGRWLKGATMPASSNLQVLAEILNIHAEWLYSGRGPMVSTSAQTPSGEVVNVVVNELPLLKSDQLDSWLSGEGSVEGVESVLVAGSVSARAFVFALEDRSLTPRLSQGALLVIDPARKVDPTLPVMARQNGAIVFGYPVVRPDGILIEPANRDYPSLIVPNSCLIGPVVALAQQFL